MSLFSDDRPDRIEVREVPVTVTVGAPPTPISTTGQGLAPDAGAVVPSGGPTFTREVAYRGFVEEVMAAFDAVEPPEPGPELARRFSIDSADKAEWLVRILLELQSQRARIKAQYRAMDRSLEAQTIHLSRRFAGDLGEWLTLRLAAQRGRRARSEKTFSGTVGVRAVPGGPRVTDKAAVAMWALQQPDAEQFGRYEFVPDVRAVAAYAKASGEDIPGVERQAPREVLYVVSDLKGPDGRRRVFPQIKVSELAALGLPAPESDEDENEEES